MTKIKYGLVIGTAFSGDQVNNQYLESMIKTHTYFKKAGIPIINMFLYNCSLISKGRCDMISQYLEQTPLSNFIFIDSDMSWEATDIMKLMNHDKGVIGATYPKKAMNWQSIQQVIHHDLADNVGELMTKSSEYTCVLKKGATRKDKNLLEVERLGTGFMMIKRDLLLKMKKKFKNLKYLLDDKKTDGIAIFDTEIRDGELIGEDYAFCLRVADIGEKVYIDPSLKIDHHGGNITFNGNFNNKLDYDQEIKSILRNSK